MTQRTTLAVRWHSILIFFTAVALTLLACSSSGDHEDLTITEGNSLLLNFTSDYVTGELRWMALDSTSLSTGTLDFWQDTRVSTDGGNIFVLENNPGNLSCILPDKIDEDGVIQKRLDANAPYEAAVIGNKGYIALNDTDYVQIFDISTCTPSGKIDMSPISGTNASSIKASGDTLLVVLQRLESWSATKPGLLVRIKASTETIIDTIQLKLYNPHSTVLSNGKLYVSSQGPYNADYSIDVTKAGIEVVDLAKGTSEVLATGTQLGGGASGIALDTASQILYVSVYEAFGFAPVKPIDLSNKSVGTALPDITDSFGGLVFGDKERKLFVGDRAYSKPGLKIYNPATKLTTIVNEGANALPPYSLAIVRW